MHDPMKVLMEEARSGARVLLAGPPATGKTARIRAVAKELGYEFICTPLHLQERVDLSGAIVPAGDVARQLPLELIARLRNAKKPVLWLIDDLGKAPIDIQGALKSLITRAGEGMSLPEHVLVWGATNRPEDAAGVRGLDEALRSEYDAAYEIQAPISIVQGGKVVEVKIPVPTERGTVPLAPWEDEVENWCMWALDYARQLEKTDPQRAYWAAQVVAFHRVTRGEWLYRWHHVQNPAERFPDFRSWHAVMKLPEPLQKYEPIAARIGHPATAAFISVREDITSMPTLDEILASPQTAPVPGEGSTAAMYLLATLIALWATLDNLRHLIPYVERLPRQFAALAAKGIARKFKDNVDKLVAVERWNKFVDRNSDLFDIE